MPFFGVPIRNGLPIGLGSVAGFGVQQFDPSELFAGGTVAGAWYDPSDLSTMFDTSTGTTPVGMPGQGAAVPVGLMLDKSQGLVLGSELVTPAANRDFSSNTGYWTPQDGSITISGGAANFSSTTNTFALYAAVGAISASLGKYYEITYTLVSCSAGAIRFGIGANYTTSRSTPGTYTERITAGAGGFFGFYAVGTTTASVDNVSVRELPGNHAIAFNNTTARPELRARVNLLTYSEQFDNGAWTASNLTVTANTAVAPDGTTTADTLNDASASFGNLSQMVSSLANSAYNFSVYIKSSGVASDVRIDLYTTIGDQFFAIFNSGTGAYVSGNGGTYTTTSVGNGWYRVSLSASGSGNTTVRVYPAGGSAGATGSIFLWGADLRPANIGANVPAYQRISDANTYDTSGFPLYLRFDGIDDSMYTPANLNLSGTDKVAVFAGVRKLSDAAQGVVAELSATIASNNGTFLLAAPDGATQTYGWDSKGTTQVDAVASSLAAPRTNVLVGTADIAGDSCIIRVNGAVADTEAGDQGSGNYGTYPLYIGARNNSSLWLNGQVYGFLVVGSAVSAGNISATEQWVAGKTGIVIP